MNIPFLLSLTSKTGPKFHFREMKLFAVPVVFLCFSQKFQFCPNVLSSFPRASVFPVFRFLFHFALQSKCQSRFQPVAFQNRILFQIHFVWGKKKSLGSSKFIFFGKKNLVEKCVFCLRFFSPSKMWVLKSLSKAVVAGPFKSEAEMARKLGVSQQYVNRQIQKYNFLFHLDGEKVLAIREKEFVGGGKRASDKEELAQRLGVSQEAVNKVFRKKTSGIVKTPQGKVKIQKLKPGRKTNSSCSPRFVE